MVGFKLWLFLSIASDAELSRDPSESQFLQFKSEPPSHRLCKALNTHREHSRLRKVSELISSSCSVQLNQQSILDSRMRKEVQSAEPAGRITPWYWDYRASGSCEGLVSTPCPRGFWFICGFFVVVVVFCFLFVCFLSQGLSIIQFWISWNLV